MMEYSDLHELSAVITSAQRSQTGEMLIVSELMIVFKITITDSPRDAIMFSPRIFDWVITDSHCSSSPSFPFFDEHCGV
jgi:hypothetical protein